MNISEGHTAQEEAFLPSTIDYTSVNEDKALDSSFLLDIPKGEDVVTVGSGKASVADNNVIQFKAKKVGATKLLSSYQHPSGRAMSGTLMFQR